jgi:hypothetical protein
MPTGPLARRSQPPITPHSAPTATDKAYGSCWSHASTPNTTRTAAVNVFKALVLTAPDQLRESLRHTFDSRQTAAFALLRVHARHSRSERVLRQTARCLAQQIRLLYKEIRANERQLHQLGSGLMPALVAEPGVGPVSAAHLIVAWSHRAGADLLLPSPPSPASAHYKRPRAASPAIASTASATAGST